MDIKKKLKIIAQTWQGLKGICPLFFYGAQRLSIYSSKTWTTLNLSFATKAESNDQMHGNQMHWSTEERSYHIKSKNQHERCLILSFTLWYFPENNFIPSPFWVLFHLIGPWTNRLLIPKSTSASGPKWKSHIDVELLLMISSVPALWFWWIGELVNTAPHMEHKPFWNHVLMLIELCLITLIRLCTFCYKTTTW